MPRSPSTTRPPRCGPTARSAGAGRRRGRGAHSVRRARRGWRRRRGAPRAGRRARHGPAPRPRRRADGGRAMTRVLLVTGSRSLATHPGAEAWARGLIREALRDVDVLLVGDATGVDRWAAWEGAVVVRHEVRVYVTHGRDAGWIIAPDDEGEARVCGTWATDGNAHPLNRNAGYWSDSPRITPRRWHGNMNHATSSGSARNHATSPLRGRGAAWRRENRDEPQLLAAGARERRAVGRTSTRSGTIMERAPSTTSLSHRSHYCAPRGPVLAGVPGGDGCRLSQGCFGRNAGAPIAPPCNAAVVAIDHAHPRRRSGPLGSRTLGSPEPVRPVSRPA